MGEENDMSDHTTDPHDKAQADGVYDDGPPRLYDVVELTATGAVGWVQAAAQMYIDKSERLRADLAAARQRIAELEAALCREALDAVAESLHHDYYDGDDTLETPDV